MKMKIILQIKQSGRTGSSTRPYWRGINSPGTNIMRNMEATLFSMARECAKSWLYDQSRNPNSFYLYYQKSTKMGEYGKIIAAPDYPEPPQGWELAWSEHLNAFSTVDQTTKQIYDILRKLPILPL